MLCQHCGKNQATTHIKSMVNGKYTEYMLCSDCAKEMGYADMFTSFDSDFNSLLGSFFSNALPERSGATRCSLCGSSYNDITSTGKVGCANCYDTFYSELMPTIRRVHGNTEHCGKRPNVFKTKEKSEQAANPEKSPIDDLKAKMEAAIKEQNFEEAARLRDEIKNLEGTK